MKYFSLIMPLMFLFSLFVEGQPADTIHLTGYKPLKCGYINKTRIADVSTSVDPVDGVQVYTCSPDSDSVFSLCKGKVLAVRNIEDEFVCIVKYSDFIYSYSNLFSSPLKKGLIIKAGDYIGKISAVTDNGLVRITIRRNNKVLSYKEHLSRLMDTKFD
jgi:hypothetical protein